MTIQLHLSHTLVECETKFFNAAWQLQATIRCWLLGQKILKFNKLHWFIVFHTSIWEGLELCLGEISATNPPWLWTGQLVTQELDDNRIYVLHVQKFLCALEAGVFEQTRYWGKSKVCKYKKSNCNGYHNKILLNCSNYSFKKPDAYYALSTSRF